jgi:hypothetical protein
MLAAALLIARALRCLRFAVRSLFVLTIPRSSPSPIPFIPIVASFSPRMVFPPTVLVARPMRIMAHVLVAIVVYPSPLSVPCVVAIVAHVGREPVGITVSSVALLVFA